MGIRPSRVRTAVIGATFVVGIVLGVLRFGPALADGFLNQSLAPAPVFPRNENGQTYGSGSDAISLDKEPDLIKAYGVGGTLGYVRSKDLIGEMPETPQEALAQQQNRPVGSVRQIPLYAVDGKTIIGVFNVVTSQGIERSATDE